MVIVHGGVRVDPDQVAEVTRRAERFQTESLAEEGCVVYQLSWQAGDPSLLRLLEIWESGHAHQAHKAAEHTTSWTEYVAGAATEAPQFTRYEFDA
jgi:quinol monooxygenase YgiN